MTDSTADQPSNLEQLGRVVRGGNDLERRCVLILSRMAFEVAGHAQIVLAGMPVSGLLDRIEAIYKLWADPDTFSPSIPGWLEVSREAVRLRNHLVHDEMWIEPDGQIRVQLQKKGYQDRPKRFAPTLLADARLTMERAVALAETVLRDVQERRRAADPEPQWSAE